MFQPKYTMNGLEVEDRMSANGNLHSRVLGVVLRSNLNDLESSLDAIVANAMTKEFLDGKKLRDGWTEVPSFLMAKRVITAANSRVFFGEQLSGNSEFLKAALEYPEDLLKAAEILRLIPSAFAPFLSPFLMRQYQASKILVRYLIPVVESRLKRRTSGHTFESHAKPVDCIEFFVDANSVKESWSAQKIVQVILGIWFASVHQPAISLVYALDDLCNYPKYAELLRNGIETCHSIGESLDSLPILDSFLKESARLHPSDSISVRRKAVRPWRFTDGTYLSEGDVACVPLQAIMRDPKLYSDSLKFDAFRFVDGTGTGNLGRFTDTNFRFPLWGLGKRAW